METPTQALHRLTVVRARAATGTSRSTIRACCRTSRPTTSSGCPGSTSATRSRCRASTLPRELPTTTAPAIAVLAGTADVAPGDARPGAALSAAAPVGRRGAHDGAAVRHLALPRRRIRRRPLPARALRRRARGSRAACGRALVRPARSRARAGGAAAARRRAGPRRHRRSLAHRLALPGARLPPRLLGCRHDARAAARGRRLGGPYSRRCTPASRTRRSRALVGADGVHEWPVAVVALGEGDAGARGRRSGDRGRDRRGAARIPARHGRAASGRPRHARSAVGPRRRRSMCPTHGRRPGRDRRARARVAAPHGSHPRSFRRRSCARACAPRCAASTSRTSSRPRRRRGSHRASTAGRTSSAPVARRRAARRALSGRLDQGLARDAAFVVIGTADVARSTTASTAKHSSPPASSRAGCIWLPTRWARARRA